MASGLSGNIMIDSTRNIIGHLCNLDGRWTIKKTSNTDTHVTDTRGKRFILTVLNEYWTFVALNKPLFSLLVPLPEYAISRHDEMRRVARETWTTEPTGNYRRWFDYTFSNRFPLSKKQVLLPEIKDGRTGLTGPRDYGWLGYRQVVSNFLK